MQKAGLPLSGKSSFAVPFFLGNCEVLNKISTKSPSEGTFQHKSLWKRGCCSTFVLQQPLFLLRGYFYHIQPQIKLGEVDVEINMQFVAPIDFDPTDQAVDNHFLCLQVSRVI